MHVPGETIPTRRLLGRVMPGRVGRLILTLGIVLVALAVLPLRSAYAAGPAINWNQCKNDSGGGSPTSGGTANDEVQDPCNWVNGNVGPSNSLYQEGDVIPQRALRYVPSAGSHYITMNHSFYDSSKDAYTYDFYATPDITLGGDLAACNDIPTTGSPWSTFFGSSNNKCPDLLAAKSEESIPTESTYPTSSPAFTYPFVVGAESEGASVGVTRNLWISCGAFNGANGAFQTGQCSNIGIEILGHGSGNGTLLADQDGPPTVDDFTQMKISFDTPADTIVAIWVGGHLAKESYWNTVSDSAYQGYGGSTAAGSSFHFKLLDWDESSAIGSKDNQMNTSAVLEPPRDWGDLPDPTTGSPDYPTLDASSGPFHDISNDLFLGNCVDAEADGQPTAGALGDDNATGSPVSGTCATTGDDEDGVSPQGTWSVGDPGTGDGGTVQITVSGGDACLWGWIDWDGNGDFGDTDETIISGAAVTTGTDTYDFSIPPAAFGNSAFFARYRLFPRVSGTCPSQTYTGGATNGEVEDYVHATGTVTAITLSSINARSVGGGSVALPVAVVGVLGLGAVGLVVLARRRRFNS